MADNAAMVAALRGQPQANPELSPQDDAAMMPETFANPLVKYKIEQAVTLPKRAIESAQHFSETGEYDPSVPLEVALSFAGGGMQIAKPGTAGIFGGRLAKTADFDKLRYANEAKLRGATPDQIWKESGWFQSPADGKWRFEIPDNKSKVNAHGIDYGKEGDFVAGPTPAMFDHPELYKAYPQFNDSLFYNTVLQNPRNGVGRGSFTPKQGIAQVEAPNLNNARDIAIHELQHGVQGIEHFTPGGNPSHMAFLQEQKPSKLPLHELETHPQDLYTRLAGEVEARNSQTRANLTPEQRRQIPPWQTQDTDLNSQLVYNPQTELVRALRRYE